jgi:hypothetical protein
VEGYELEGVAEIPENPGERMMEYARVNGYLLGSIGGGALGSAIIAHLLIRWLGWVKGLGAFGAFFYGVVLKVVSPWFIKKIMRVEAMEGPSL